MLLSPDRLAELQRTALLDSPCEEAFDRLTRLASSFLSAPTSVLTLVDGDRQFFKSAVGLPEVFRGARSTSMDYSFSRHVVDSGEPLVLPDVRAHPRTRSNAAIVEAGIIAYAGIPLRTSSGHVLGALCVLDVVPRQWTDREIEVLTDLAAVAKTELSLRSELAQREQFEHQVVERALLIERERMNAMFEDAPAFIAWARGPGHVLQGANRAFRQLVGSRDIVGKRVADAIPEAEANGLLVELDRVLSTGVPFVAQGLSMLLQRDPRGEPEERYLNFVYQPLYENDGAPSGVLCHGVDVTDQVRAAMEVERSERHHRHLLDSLPIIVYQAAPEPPYPAIYLNKAIEVLGYSREEWMNEPEMWLSLLHRDDRGRISRLIREALESGTTMDCEYRLVGKDGSIRWFHDRGEFVPDRSGERFVWQGIMLDITERRKAEEALRDSEALHRKLIETAHEGIWVVDQVGVSTYTNPRLCEMLGYDAHEIEGRSFFDFMPAADAFQARTLFARRQRGIAEVHEFTFLRRDGSELFVLLSASPMMSPDGEFTGALAMLTDVTERRRTAQELREAETRYRLMVAHAPGLVYQWTYLPDGTGRFNFVSEGAQAILGISPQEALTDPEVLLGLIPSDDRPRFHAKAMEAAATSGPFRWEGRAVLRSGEERFIEIAARSQRKPDGAVLSDGIMMDVTARRQLEHQLRQAQKMEAVGRLAGGVAHDFNNLITIIKASSSFLLAELDAADARADDVRQISDAADRAAGLTRQLLAFSRKQILNPRVLFLNSVVENFRPLLSRLIGEDVSVETRLAADMGSIMGDVGQLEQVLINLAVNARDAMPDGGHITIETAEVRITEEYGSAHSEHEDVVVLPGRYAVLSVSDTGVGMTPDIRARVFEPFFTTKPAGKGTGLGLSTVYGIVKQSGGHIWVYSEPGHGTVFKLYFPMLAEQAAAPLARVPDVPPVRGTETVLLVEDEDGLRRLARRILERQGYTVLESRNGREALEVATRHEHPIHLVLTDVIMPEMSGRGLVERLHAVRPSAAVIYMSGYTNDDMLRRELFEPGSRFVQKPFVPEELLRMVREVLDRSSGT